MKAPVRCRAFMAQTVSFTTNGMHPAQATELWREAFCSNVMCADPRFLEPETFRVDFDLIASERMSLLRAHMASIEHARGPSQTQATETAGYPSCSSRADGCTCRPEEGPWISERLR